MSLVSVTKLELGGKAARTAFLPCSLRCVFKAACKCYAGPRIRIFAMTQIYRICLVRLKTLWTLVHNVLKCVRGCERMVVMVVVTGDKCGGDYGRNISGYSAGCSCVSSDGNSGVCDGDTYDSCASVMVVVAMVMV